MPLLELLRHAMTQGNLEKRWTASPMSPWPQRGRPWPGGAPVPREGFPAVFG